MAKSLYFCMVDSKVWLIIMQQDILQKNKSLFAASNFCSNLVLLDYRYFQQINNGGTLL